MVRGPGQHPAGIWIPGRPLKDVRHAKQKKKSDWMSPTFDFDVLPMMCLRQRESITSRSGWMENQQANQGLLLKKKRKRSAGMPGTRCPVPFFYLWKIWSKRTVTRPNKSSDAFRC